MGPSTIAVHCRASVVRGTFACVKTTLNCRTEMARFLLTVNAPADNRTISGSF
jgi:hypothetical protein